MFLGIHINDLKEKFEKNCEIILIITALYIFNVSVLINIPYLRPISSFIVLFFLPGYLFYKIFLININKFFCLLLSIGLSISFNMFLGIFINFIYILLGYPYPLSLTVYSIFFNIVIIILIFILFLKTRNNQNSDLFFKIRLIKINKNEYKLLALSVLLLFFAYISTYFINNYDTNLFYYFYFILLIIIIIAIILNVKNLNENFLFLCLFIISLSVILIIPFRVGYLMGDDIFAEYRLFNFTLKNLSWGIYENNALDTCLGSSILPTIFENFLNVNPINLFRFFYPLIFSFLPVIVFSFALKFFPPSYSFFVGLFIVIQNGFIYAELFARTNLAIFFIALALLVILNEEFPKYQKNILFIIFGSSCVVSHYTTTFILLIILSIALIIFYSFNFIKRRIKNDHEIKKFPVSLLSIFLLFLITFFWHSFIVSNSFETGISVIDKTINNFDQFYLIESRGRYAESATGYFLQDEYFISNLLKFIINWLFIFSIIIGLTITLFQKLKTNSYQNKISDNYLFFGISAFILILISLLSPGLLLNYGLNRLLFTMMIFFAPYIIIVDIIISKKKLMLKYVYLLVLFSLLFSSNFGIIDSIFGNNLSIILNNNGPNYEFYYIHDRDYYGADWINNYSERDLLVYTDETNGLRRTLPYFFNINIDNLRLFDDKIPNNIKNKYIGLSYSNIFNEQLFNDEFLSKNFSLPKFQNLNYIYNSNGPLILYE